MLHKLLQKCLEDDGLDAFAKVELSLAEYHVIRATDKQTIIENEKI